jgi:hypothetical protein
MSTVAGRGPSRYDAGALLSGDVPGLLIVASRDPDAKVTYLPAGAPPAGADPGRGEELVVKLATSAGADEAVEREGRMLVDLRRRGLGEVAGTVPRYVASRRLAGRHAVISTAMPGRPMSVDYHGWWHTARPDSVHHDFATAEDWLSRFQAATASTPGPLTWPFEVGEALSRRWDGHPDLDRGLARVEKAAHEIAGSLGPRTAVHGDFWFGNLMVAGGKVVGVVDWEAAEPVGAPHRDLARFAISYSLYLDRHTRPGHRVIGHPGLRRAGTAPGLVHGLTGHGWYPRLVRGFLTTGLTRLGVPARGWYDVALCGVAEVAAQANDDRFAEDHLQVLAALPTHARRYR